MNYTKLNHAGDDRVSITDADRHDDISRNGSSGFGGSADSAETAGLGGVISEGANVDLLAEACLLGLCFECLDFDCISVGSAFCASIWL